MLLKQGQDPMPTPSPNVPQVAPLTASQIAQFKRDGVLVLPAVLDPELCRRARDDMWETIAADLPRMKRDDPSTWGPITEEETAGFSARRPADGGEPLLSGKGHRLTIRNGSDDLALDLGPRAAWQVAEQLLGKDTVVWPAGQDQSGFTTGPCFMDDGAMEGLSSHMGRQIENYREAASYATEDLRVPKTGPVWMNGQGTRGLYCTLPNSPSPGPNWRGSHSDGPCYGRTRLQFAAYIDDLPPASGGFTVWPGSHTRIWEQQWKAFHEHGTTHTGQREQMRMAGGYDALPDPLFEQIKADTQPFETHGPAGTLVLWHTKILHIPGQNQSSDVIRQATIYGYLKTLESLSDALAMDDDGRGIWRDWSDEVRAIDERS